MTRILVLAGSARRESVNKKLARSSADKLRGLGVEATFLDLAEHPIPLYDGDLEAEQGVPEHAAYVRRQIVEHDAVLFVCPEYNGSVTPLWKNLIDWVSRPDGDAAPGVAYNGLVAGLMSASPGALGGMRGLFHARAILSGLGVHVVPGDVSVGSAHQAFTEDGELADERVAARFRALLEGLVAFSRVLKESRTS